MDFSEAQASLSVFDQLEELEKGKTSYMTSDAGT